MTLRRRGKVLTAADIALWREVARSRRLPRQQKTQAKAGDASAEVACEFSKRRRESLRLRLGKRERRVVERRRDGCRKRLLNKRESHRPALNPRVASG